MLIQSKQSKREKPLVTEETCDNTDTVWKTNVHYHGTMVFGKLTCPQFATAQKNCSSKQRLPGTGLKSNHRQLDKFCQTKKEKDLNVWNVNRANSAQHQSVKPAR